MPDDHVLREGPLCGEKLRLPDGSTGCSIWYELPDEGEGLVCMAFDINDGDIDHAIALLTALKTSDPVDIPEPTEDGAGDEHDEAG